VRRWVENCEAKDSLKQAEHKYESKDKLRVEDIEKEDVRNDEASNTLEISEDTENVVNSHDKRSQEDMAADHDLQGKHSGLNEAVNMDVRRLVASRMQLIKEQSFRKKKT
jgi:hypothetical protein